MGQGLASTLSNAGFDPARMVFAIRTALAACLALIIAWAMGLEHPQWSAMTVWAASQPLRGMLVEKGFFRAAGTLVGVVFGVLLVWVSGNQPWALALGLALWIGLAAAAANLVRGLLSYGAILAGFSAAMVSMLDTAHPDQILVLGADRFATVMVGVVTATLVGLTVRAGRGSDEAVGRSRRLTARVLRDLAARLAADPNRDAEAEERAILSEMAVIDELLDPHGAGSLRSRRSAVTLRAALLAHVEALLMLRGGGLGPPDPDLAKALIAAAEVFESAAGPDDVREALDRASAIAAGHPQLQVMLDQVSAVANERIGLRQEGRANLKALPPVVLHRDWILARQAGLRAFGLIALMGLFWVVTGWSLGPFLLLGGSVMITLFSTFDHPAGIMGSIIWGQLFGALAALACRWLVWPYAGGEGQVIAMMIPFILIGILPISHRKTMTGAMDYNLVMLLLMQPHYPLTGTFSHSMMTIVAVLAAPIAALAAFLLVFPVDPRRRMESVMTMMIHDLGDMAGDPNAVARRPVWRARVFHRVLRLVRWSDKAGAPMAAAQAGLTTLTIGGALQAVHSLRDDPKVGGEARAVLARGRAIGRDPAALRQALERLAEIIDDRPDAPLLRAAAAALAANPDLFRPGN